MEQDAVRAVTQRLEAVFTAIEHERMAGVPILNTALKVAAVGTQRFGADWLTILVTPWCMNIMLLPDGGKGETWPDWQAGVTLRRSLPGGVFSFICGEEAALGRYLMCSLFSPMHEFADQEAVLATAEAALRELITPAVDTAAQMAVEPRPEATSRSRRAMFGLGGKDEASA
jgi:[NiFe] hydrogenase assembly HybE family chaperone